MSVNLAGPWYMCKITEDRQLVQSNCALSYIKEFLIAGMVSTINDVMTACRSAQSALKLLTWPGRKQ